MMSLTFALRWTARVWSAASTLLILAFVFGGAESLRTTPKETVALLLFPTTVIIGFAIAWWREGLGGAISLSGLALFYVWMFASSGRTPSGPYFVLFTFPAFLFLANALLFGSRKSVVN